MTCTRCEGLMLEEHMIDMEGAYGEMWSRSWRCFNCGHRDDAVIQQHRQQQAQSCVVSPHAVTVQERVESFSEPVEPLAA
jgi:C4-type Zn-finger protein